MLVLDCARIDQKCPRFPFANVGGDSCDVTSPRVMDQVFHHTIPQEGRGTFEVPLSRSTWTVANAHLYDRHFTGERDALRARR